MISGIFTLKNFHFSSFSKDAMGRNEKWDSKTVFPDYFFFLNSDYNHYFLKVIHDFLNR